MADPEHTEAPSRPRDENSIHVSRKLRQEGNAQKPAENVSPPASSHAKPTQAVPEAVRQRFVVVKNRYYFHDGTRAFTDRGTRLTTASENTQVIRSLIQIAEARGWSEITVRGTERFRKEAWLAAQLSGIDVRGYRPSEFERGRLARAAAREAPVAAEDSVTLRESGARVAEPPPPREELLSGRLVDHGRATYRHDPRQPMSYFVKLETARGSRTIWGVDLERAFRESLTKPYIGDEVGLRSLRQEPVKVRRGELDATGGRSERELATHRNHWVVERHAFFEGREDAARIVRDSSLTPKQAVEKHPELLGTLLEVHLAKLAAKKLDPKDQERFVATVRSALAERIARGEPLPAVRLRTPARAPTPPEREPVRVRG